MYLAARRVSSLETMSSSSSNTLRRRNLLFLQLYVVVIRKPMDGQLTKSQNVTSSSTVVASLEAARDKKAPVILQMSQGGAAYFAGKVKNYNRHSCHVVHKLMLLPRELQMAISKHQSLGLLLVLSIFVPSPLPTKFRSSSILIIAQKSFSHGWMACWMQTRNTLRNMASLYFPAT